MFLREWENESPGKFISVECKVHEATSFVSFVHCSILALSRWVPHKQFVE